MDIIFINVGYGDAILIKHNSQYGLIDGGSGNQEEFQGDRISLREYLMRENITILEFVIITHIHEDHVCGISEILDCIEIKKFFVPYMPQICDYEDIYIGTDLSLSLFGYVKALNTFKNILSYAEDNAISCANILNFDSIHPLGSDVEIKVLEPLPMYAEKYTRRIETVFHESDVLLKTSFLETLEKDSNDHSLVLGISYDKFLFILTADNCPVNWRPSTFSFVQNGNVLKLPHHGQMDSINKELLGNIGVEYIVTSASSDHRNNSSNCEVYRQLQETKGNLKFLFTDEIEYKPFFTRVSAERSSIQFTVKNKTIKVNM